MSLNIITVTLNMGERVAGLERRLGKAKRGSLEGQVARPRLAPELLLADRPAPLPFWEGTCRAWGGCHRGSSPSLALRAA